MKMTRIVAAGATALFAATALAMPASASNVGNEGCTPGYWKNHTSNWSENDTIKFDAKKLTLAKAGFVTRAMPNADLVLTALSYKGGPRAAGAEQILMRAAAAAWLNAATEELGYPLHRYKFVPEVNAAIASGDRATMIALAAKLDALNNLGCPLN